MRLAALLIAAPAVLQLVAADPRPMPASNELKMRRVLDRWHFQRQDSTAGASTPAAGATATNKETTPAASPTTSTTPVASPSPSPTTSTTPIKTPDPETTSSTSNSTPAETSATSATQPTSQAATSQTQPTSQSANTQGQPSNTTPAQVLSTPSPSSSILVTTGRDGGIITSVVVIQLSPTAISPSASSTSTDGESKPISKGTIIGLAVTGSIAVLIVILLIVWKLTNKRFSDLDETGDDAIKWPELNKDSAAMTPLPARPTGRSGVDTGVLDNFDAQSSAANSTADLSGAHYQPYSDDPGYGARPAYYDPYGGAPGAARPYASPPGSHDGDHKNWGGPADANQYYDAPRGPSPGPNMAYGDAMGRGTSPGPNMAYGDALGRGASPGPNMAYGDSLGRGTSPGPNMAYADPMGRTASPAPAGYGGYPAGYGAEQVGGDPYAGRHSPGPGLAYGGSQNDHAVDPYGRRSPGPGVAYGGGRAASPGPNTAYDQGGYR